MKFFLPDWDDRVDPGYDFRTDRFSLNRDPYEDDLYGHEVYPERIYDGLLVSRMALGETGPKRELVEKFGMRAYLRLPSDLMLLGDCGAYGYIRESVPRFEPEELVDYYDRLRFDLGVSVDHIIVTGFLDQRQPRYNLTLGNAERFITEHRRRNAGFEPVGAVQGWDIASYTEAALAIVAMGYRYIAIGGLVRSRTDEIDSIITAVVSAVPKETHIHVFGVARTSLLHRFCHLSITSVDSAAPLRQAWLSSHENYYTPERAYIAFRIPIADQERPKPQTLVGRSPVSLAMLREAEHEALAAVREYAHGNRTTRSTLTALMAYDELLAERLDKQKSQRRKSLYAETLRDRPWKRCPCVVCRDLGVEVIIFRGNNRNRRRGFHNLWMLRQRMSRPGQPASDVMSAPPHVG